MISVAIEDKVLALLAKDGQFGTQVMPYMYEDLFTQPQHKAFFNLIKHFYVSFGIPPTLELIAHEAKKNVDTLQPEVFRALGEFIFNVYNSTDMIEERYVKGEIISFVRVAAMRNVIAEGGAILNSTASIKEQNERIGDIVKKFERARTAGDVVARPPVELFRTIESRVLEREKFEKFSRIPTGMEPLDEVLRGGLSEGELGIVYGQYNVGKSFFLSQLLVNAGKARKRALYVSLELSALEVFSRVEANITGIPSTELCTRSEELLRVKNEFFAPYQDFLFVQEYPTGSLHVEGLNAICKQFEANFGKLDLVLVDGADNLFIKNHNDTRFELKHIYTRLRSIAQENKVGLWTVSQINREGLDATTARGKHSAESIDKLFIADVVITLNQREAEYPSRVRAWLEKNRRNKKWIEFPCTVDYSIGRVEMSKANQTVMDPANIDLIKEAIARLPQGHGSTIPGRSVVESVPEANGTTAPQGSTP